MIYNVKRAREKSWKREYPVFKKMQEIISKEKLNKYGFNVTIQKTRERRLKQNHINCGSGFEHAHIEFKGTPVAIIYSQFNNEWEGEPKIEYLWIKHHWKSFLEEINYSRSERKLPLIEFQRDGHKTLQSCLYELETLRILIVKHFTK